MEWRVQHPRQQAWRLLGQLSGGGDDNHENLYRMASLPLVAPEEGSGQKMEEATELTSQAWAEKLRGSGGPQPPFIRTAVSGS